MTYENLSYLINCLILLKTENLMDINVQLLPWLMYFFHKISGTKWQKLIQQLAIFTLSEI